MNIADLERALTAYFAEYLGLAVDERIFRGQLPPELDGGVAVRIESVDASAADFGEPEYLVQILGKFDDRDEALALADRLARMPPRYGVMVGEFRAAYLLTFGSGAPYMAPDNGKVRHFVSHSYRFALQ